MHSMLGMKGEIVAKTAGNRLSPHSVCSRDDDRKLNHMNTIDGERIVPRGFTSAGTKSKLLPIVLPT